MIDSNNLNAKMRDLSALAQLVEQMTVNHWVAGSSPAGGAKYKKGCVICSLFCFNIPRLNSIKSDTGKSMQDYLRFKNIREDNLWCNL